MKCILAEDSSVYNIEKFINEDIVQKNIKLKEIYDQMEGFNYKFIACIENNECVGILPFILYKNEIANVINSMPFIGYGGISVRDNDEKTFKFIVDFLIKYAEENDVKLVTICTQPFQGQKYELYNKYFNPDFKKENFYQYIELEDFKLEKLKSKLRYYIRRYPEKYNITIAESNDLKDLSYWYENIYLERLTKTGCVIYPYSVFEGLLKNTNPSKIKMAYAIMDGEIIGGSMFLNQGNSVDCFMRVIGTPFMYTRVGRYLDYYSIQYALNEGIKYFNWQSCDEIGSNIFKYKEEWGSKLDYHHYLTKITGDISELKKVPLEIIKKEFKGIYVMPYEEFERQA